MTYFISAMLLIIAIPYPVFAQDNESAAPNKGSIVPHNNGTDGLLKNTFIEPIVNFKNISKAKKTNNFTENKLQNSTLDKTPIPSPLQD